MSNWARSRTRPSKGPEQNGWPIRASSEEAGIYRAGRSPPCQLPSARPASSAARTGKPFWSDAFPMEGAAKRTPSGPTRSPVYEI